MDVQASPAGPPDWPAFLGAFQVRFRRPEGQAALERDTTGLLTELPTKHGDTMAGLTSCGRTTIEALRLNNDWIVQARRLWMLVGLHPPLES